jgi:hypothetical protein
MADQSDVETALTGVIAGVLYPQGSDGPSILDRTVRIHRGWPNAAALDADLALGVVTVTVFPEPAHQRVTTRWAEEETPLDPVLPTLRISTDAITAVVSGAALPGQLAGLIVDRMAVVHRTQAGDTPELVAAILAADIRTRRIAQLDGASITIPGVGLLVGRVVADQGVQRITRQQRQGFRVTAWCPDPATRDAVCAAVDAAVSAIDFLSLPDGTVGRLNFRSSTVFDQSQDAALYRRDLVYTVEYATAVTTTLPAMIAGDIRLAPNGSSITQNLLG